MTKLIFEPVRFVPRMPLGRVLGQEATAEQIPIVRELAQAVSDAIKALIQNPTTPEVYAKEACWRDLRSRRWPQVTALQNRISNFMASQDKEMTVTDAEWALMDNALACVEAIHI